MTLAKDNYRMPVLLRAKKAGWFRSDYIILLGDEEVATVDWLWSAEPGEFIVADESYTIGRAEEPSEYRLSHDGAPVCRATEHGFFSRSFRLIYGDQEFDLKPGLSLANCRFVLQQEDTELGVITPAYFSYSIEAELPDSLPLAVRIFLVWLIIVFRQSSD